SAPAANPATPMLEFFQKRMETLERELSLEHERSRAAQEFISRQEALKSEVESNLKDLSAQLRREKSEKESTEARIHAQGRIEALEKRLDEMNATFAQLLKEAVGRREADGPSAAALTTELASFRNALKDAVDGLARWKGELSKRLPKEEKNFEESLSRRLDEFSARVTRSLDDWKRSQKDERQRQDERLEAMTRERADLARLWDDQSRLLREEQFKDRVARESEVSRQVSALASRLEALAEDQKSSVQGASSVREDVARVLALLTATPKAKDMLIAQADAESAELRRALAESQEALRRFAGERRDVEKSMGDSLVRLSAELENERARTRAADALASARLGETEKLKTRLPDLERSISERDERLTALHAERDELMKSLVAETEKVRLSIEERRKADADAEAQAALLRKRLEEEAARRDLCEGAAGNARAGMAAMADQLARTLQERDATLARFSEWEKERQRNLETLQKKDEMISLLSATVQGALKKSA
ncbi:MAG: hypothetical protein AAB262_14560, partial [Elusimicrobiota bacterium]